LAKWVFLIQDATENEEQEDAQDKSEEELGDTEEAVAEETQEDTAEAGDMNGEVVTKVSGKRKVDLLLSCGEFSSCDPQVNQSSGNTG